MEKVLFAVDELTGLIGAAALMRPSRSVQDMELKSLKKKFKDKKFAAGCSREVIEREPTCWGGSLTSCWSAHWKLCGGGRASQRPVRRPVGRLENRDGRLFRTLLFPCRELDGSEEMTSAFPDVK